MASSLARPAPAKLKTRSEFSITLEVKTSNAGHWYRYEYKESGSKNVQYVDAAPEASEVLLDDLNPTSSYEVRVYEVYKCADGREQVSVASEIAVVDTEVPSCRPGSSPGCLCYIQ
ncbi:hypothetical protein CCR75_004113 [Bremia lactucae]|uniref:Fibronectin type-III domain-containing protein n=1 Tax=Bremia lactucae TaxID=4779 RepID=A0A976FK53_BRELC|nr:hypothetical protein CCR75_004113 [Bremia lactucae]